MFNDEVEEINDEGGGWLVITDAGGGLLGFATYVLEVTIPNVHS